jgi:hypothetical protein
MKITVRQGLTKSPLWRAQPPLTSQLNLCQAWLFQWLKAAEVIEKLCISLQTVLWD